MKESEKELNKEAYHKIFELAEQMERETGNLRGEGSGNIAFGISCTSGLAKELVQGGSSGYISRAYIEEKLECVKRTVDNAIGKEKL